MKFAVSILCLIFSFNVYASDVEFSLVNEVPTVIHDSITVEGPRKGNRTIRSNWITIDPLITNNSKFDLKVLKYKVVSTFYDSNGDKREYHTRVDPKDYRKNFSNNYPREYMAYVRAGETFEEYETLYVPEVSPNKIYGPIFEHKLKITAVGWFTKDGHPIERFSQTIETHTK